MLEMRNDDCCMFIKSAIFLVFNLRVYLDGCNYIRDTLYYAMLQQMQTSFTLANTQMCVHKDRIGFSILLSYITTKSVNVTNPSDPCLIQQIEVCLLYTSPSPRDRG